MLAVPRGPVRDGNRSSATSNALEELESIARGFEGVEQASRFKQAANLRVIASAKDYTTMPRRPRFVARSRGAFEQQLTYR